MLFPIVIGGPNAGPNENDGQCLNVRETEPNEKEKNGECL
jgi:hypothetical protein